MRRLIYGALAASLIFSGCSKYEDIESYLARDSCIEEGVDRFELKNGQWVKSDYLKKPDIDTNPEDYTMVNSGTVFLFGWDHDYVILKSPEYRVMLIDSLDDGSVSDMEDDIIDIISLSTDGGKSWERFNMSEEEWEFFTRFFKKYNRYKTA